MRKAHVVQAQIQLTKRTGLEVRTLLHQHHIYTSVQDYVSALQGQKHKMDE